MEKPFKVMIFIHLFELNNFMQLSVLQQSSTVRRPAWAGFKTAEEGRTKIM